MLDTKDQNYHHGNVKNELVTTAMRLMEVEDLEKISLRRLAREIGVTPAAVYNHFSSKQEMMATVKSRAFDKMHEYLKHNCIDHAEPEREFEEICQAYIDFSQQHPSLFDVLFSVRVSPESSESIISAASDNRPDRLGIIIKRLYDKHKIPITEDRLVLSTVSIWAQLHGLVTLSNSGAILIAISRSDLSQDGSAHDYLDMTELIRQYTLGFYRSLRQQQTSLQSSSNNQS